MIIEGSTLENQYTCDHCVIGSGIGGSSVVSELLKNDKDFILIEAGGMSNTSNNINATYSGQDLNMPISRSISLGGTSNVWGGGLTPLDKIDFKSKDIFEKNRWPISYEDLKKYYEHALKIFGIPNIEHFNERSLSKLRKKQLYHLPFNKNVIKNKLFQIPLPIFNFKDFLINVFDKSNRRHCIFNAPALEINYHDDKAISVVIGTKSGLKTIKANHFYICSGAIETPRLLLNSGFRNKNIGKYLMDHPKGYLAEIDLKDNPLPKDHIYAVMKYYDDLNLQVKSGLIMKEDYLKKHNLLNHNVYIKPIYKDLKTMEKIEELGVLMHTYSGSNKKIKDFFKFIINFKTLLRGAAYKFDLNQSYNKVGIFVVSEQSPSINSYVKLSSKVDSWGYPTSHVHWCIEEKDFDNILKFNEKLMKNLGLEHHKFSNISDVNSFKEKVSSAAHHLGTARISENPDLGVVDGFLKVHGFRNILICDGSVFPSSGNANPSLTISALALRGVEYYLRGI